MAESTSGNLKRLIGRLAPTAENRCATKPAQRIKKNSYWRLLRKGLRPKSLEINAAPMDSTETQKLGVLVREADDVAWIRYASVRALGYACAAVFDLRRLILLTQKGAK